MASRADAEGGYVLIYRRLLEHPAFRTDAEAMVFAWLVLRASWKAVRVRYKGHPIDLERGQLAISVRDLADRFEWSKDRTQRFLKALANRDMIATDRATGVNVITIRKYDDYQPSKEGTATPRARQPRQQRDSSATQNNEVNEGNEGIHEQGAGAGNDAVRKGADPKPHRLPDGWEPKPITGPKTVAIVEAWPDGRFEEEVEKFRNHHSAKGTLFVDWDAALRTWIGNTESFKGKRHGNGTGQYRADADGPRHSLSRAAADVIAEGRH